MQFIQDKIDVFKNLHIPEFFGIDYYDEICPVVEEWIEALRQCGVTFEWFHGVSKVACLFPESEWVVKVPFNGHFSYKWDEKLGDYDFEDSDWIPFVRALGYEWDYCAVEVDEYKSAKDIGLEVFFAETRKLCDAGGRYPIYIQERVSPCDSTGSNKTPSNKAMRSAKKMNTCRFDLEWVATAIDCYGEELVDKFLYYVNEEYPHIGDDMHAGNYGYRKDGTPCLLDFSDWREED